MKVLEILGEPIANGGQESFVVNVLSYMDMKDLSIDLLTPYYCDNDYYRKVIERIGGEIYTFDLPFCPGGFRFNVYRPLSRFLKANRYDVVHIHSGSISVLATAAFCARMKKIKKIVVHSHCAAEKATLKYRLVKFTMALAMRVCPTDYCACSYKAGEWKFSSKVVKEKLRILKNGVDLNLFSFNKVIRERLRSELGIKSGDFVVGHVGRFSHQKNHEFLLKVFSEIRKKGWIQN